MLSGKTSLKKILQIQLHQKKHMEEEDLANTMEHYPKISFQNQDVTGFVKFQSIFERLHNEDPLLVRLEDI